MRLLLAYMLFVFLLVFTFSSEAQAPVYQQWHPYERGVSRIVNARLEYTVCYLTFMNGYTESWELYRGQVTRWAYIRHWNCK